MPLKGQNITRAKQTNRSKVLQSLLRYEPTSRHHIAEMTNLTSATITNLTAELIEEGLIREVGYLQDGEKRAGRKFVALALNSDAYWVVGVHISYGLVEFGLVNLSGELRRSHQFPISVALDENALIEQLEQGLDAFLSEIGDVQVRAIGIGCLGLINFEKGEVLAVEHMGWGTVSLAARLTKRFQLPVYLDNNVRAMALGEKMFGDSKQVSNFLCIFIGEGIGSGLILSDELYRGGRTGAGEFGHMTYLPDGSPCWCGNHGCLEQYSSNSALVRKLGAASLQQVISDYRQGRPEAAEAIRQAGQAIGTALASYINVFHVDKAVIAGVLASPDFPLLVEVEKELQSRSFLFRKEKVEVGVSGLGKEIGLAGAASLALYYEVFNK